MRQERADEFLFQRSVPERGARDARLFAGTPGRIGRQPRQHLPAFRWLGFGEQEEPVAVGTLGQEPGDGRAVRLEEWNGHGPGKSAVEEAPGELRSIQGRGQGSHDLRISHQVAPGSEELVEVRPDRDAAELGAAREPHHLFHQLRHRLAPRRRSGRQTERYDRGTSSH